MVSYVVQVRDAVQEYAWSDYKTAEKPNINWEKQFALCNFFYCQYKTTLNARLCRLPHITKPSAKINGLLNGAYCNRPCQHNMAG